MFGSLSFNEILFIMVLALLIFGPKRLPQMGRTLGRALGEFRRASSDLKRSMEVEMTLAEERERATASLAPVAAAGTEPRRHGGAASDAARFDTAEVEIVEEPALDGGAEPEDDQPDFGVPEPGAASGGEDALERTAGPAPEAPAPEAPAPDAATADAAAEPRERSHPRPIEGS
jgi:TatA/E family protein of Tat protein translocase